MVSLADVYVKVLNVEEHCEISCLSLQRMFIRRYPTIDLKASVALLNQEVVDWDTPLHMLWEKTTPLSSIEVLSQISEF